MTKETYFEIACLVGLILVLAAVVAVQSGLTQ